MSIVHIIVHGLIALVPATDAAGMANHMTALLVDAREQPSGFSTCFAEHRPEIKFRIQESNECEEAGCESSGLDTCTCPLGRKEIAIQATRLSGQASLKRQINPKPPGSLPFDLKASTDFSYVANLSSMGYELDQRFLEPIPPPALVARMAFPFESVSACALGTRRDEGSENVHAMSFRPLAQLEKPGDPNQALAQAVSATFTASEDPVRLVLSDFGGENPVTLTLKSFDGTYEIELLNMRISENGHHDLPPDDPCDGGVERDFAFFYNLAKNPPAWKDRPIPHVKYTRWKSIKDLDVPECQALKGDHLPNSHPICALASFRPAATGDL